MYICVCKAPTEVCIGVLWFTYIFIAMTCTARVGCWLGALGQRSFTDTRSSNQIKQLPSGIFFLFRMVGLIRGLCTTLEVRRVVSFLI